MTLLTLSMFLFFLIYGLTTLGSIAIPSWVLGVLAFLVALCLLIASFGSHVVF